MTALAQRIMETPMAPYMGLLDAMTIEQKKIVVTFLTESMKEPLAPEATAEEPVKAAKTNAEIIREKFKDLTISPETKELVRGLSLSAEEIDDERTKYVLGYK